MEVRLWTCVSVLQVVRGCEGYGDIVFPHCPCDSRKKGHVVAFVGYKSFRLQACKEDGSLQVKIASRGGNERGTRMVVLQGNGRKTKVVVCPGYGNN